MKIVLSNHEKVILKKLQHGAKLCSLPGVYGPHWSTNHESIDETALENLVNIGFVRITELMATSLVPPGSHTAIGTTLFKYEYIPKNYRTIK